MKILKFDAGRYSEMKMLVYTILAGFVLLIVASCSSSGKSSDGTSGTSSIKIDKGLDHQTFPIMINSFGVIPIPYGQTSISTNTWVHNNDSKNQISGITYSASFNGVDVTKSVIDQDSVTNNSSVIAPVGEAPLLIHTPVACANGGGVTITAHYVLNKTPMSYSSTFTCENVSDEISRGVIFGNYSPAAYNVDGQQQYVTLYALGSGYDVIYDKLKATASPGVEIINNNFAQTGMTFASNEIQAIELSVDPKVVDANLTLKSANGNKVFMSRANVGVMQQSGPVLFALDNILFDSSQTDRATINVTNPGVESVSVTSVTSSNSRLGIQNGCSFVSPGGTCSMTVQLSMLQSESDLQSSLITMSYTGTQTGIVSTSVVNVQWFNKTGFQPLIIRASNTIGTFISLSYSELVTISNPGGYPLQLPSTLPAITDLSGNTAIVTAQLSYVGGGGACVSSQILTQGQSCTLKLAFSSSAVASGNFLLNIPFSLGSTLYNRYYMVSYSVLPYAPLITANPSSINQPTTGLLGQITKTITLSNSGPVAGVVSVSTPAYNVTTQKMSSTCPGGNSSLTYFDRMVSAQLGSVPAASGGVPGTCSITYVNSIGATTSMILVLSYYGGSISSASPTLYSIPMVWSLSDGLNKSFAATGHISGSGTSASPFVFSGASTAPKVITFTVTNNVDTGESLKSITNNNAASLWQLTNTGINPCIAYSTRLNPGQSCTLTFTNVMSNTNLGSMTSFNSSLTIPTIYVQSDSGTGLNAANTLTVYTIMNQAVVTSQVQMTSGNFANPTVTFSVIVTNESGYMPFTWTGTSGQNSTSTSGYVSNLFSSYTITSGLCSVNGLSSSDFSQTCSFANNPNISSESASVTYYVGYPINFGYAFRLYSALVKNGQIISSPNSPDITLNIKPLHVYLSDNNGRGVNVRYFYHMRIQGPSAMSYVESVPYPSEAPAEYVGLGSFVSGNYLYLMLGTRSVYSNAPEPVTANGSIYVYAESATTGTPRYTGTALSMPPSVTSWHPVDMYFESMLNNGVTYNYTYIVDDLNKAVWIYTPSANGVLTYSGSVAMNPAIINTGVSPVSITVDESAHAYISYNSQSNQWPLLNAQLWSYSINPTTGGLTPMLQIQGTPTNIIYIRENQGSFYLTSQLASSYGSTYSYTMNNNVLVNSNSFNSFFPAILNNVLVSGGTNGANCGAYYNIANTPSSSYLPAVSGYNFAYFPLGGWFTASTCSFVGPAGLYQP